MILFQTSVIALNEIDSPDRDNEGAVFFNKLSQHFDWKSIGICSKNLRQTIYHEPIDVDIKFKHSEELLFWIPGLGRIVTLISEFSISEDYLLKYDWPNYWIQCENKIRNDWITSGNDESYQDIDWVFTFISSDDAVSFNLKNLVKSNPLKSKYNWVDSDGMQALVDWNGAIIINDPKKSQADCVTILGIIVVLSIQWQVNLMTLKTIRNLLALKSKYSKDTETVLIADLARKSNFSQVKLLSIYVNDHILPELFRKAWAMDRFRDQLNQTINRIATLNEIHSSIHARLSNAKQENLLFLISLTGVSAAVAGIISTVDFKNSAISSEVFRFILVLLSAIVIAFIAYLNRKKFP